MKKYVFGYGSLINLKYSKELNKKNNRIIIPVIIKNLERHLILCNSKNQYFGVYDNNNYNTNGILIEVDDDELIKLDKRETYYKRYKINNDRAIYKYIDYNLNDDDIIYVYYPTSHNTVKTIYNKSEQIKNYMIICLSGCIKINRNFLIDFLFTTYGIKNSIEHILDK